jgi:beta-glucosidase
MPSARKSGTGTGESRSALRSRSRLIDGEPALPLDGRSLRHLAVVGALAARQIEGDIGSSRVFPPDAMTILAGLRERLGDGVVHVGGTDAEYAGAAARRADAAVVVVVVVVVVVGLSSRDAGEPMIAVGADAAATSVTLPGWSGWACST